MDVTRILCQIRKRSVVGKFFQILNYIQGYQENRHENEMLMLFVWKEKDLTISGLGAGKGSEAQMTKLTAANQKPLTL